MRSEEREKRKEKREERGEGNKICGGGCVVEGVCAQGIYSRLYREKQGRAKLKSTV